MKPQEKKIVTTALKNIRTLLNQIEIILTDEAVVVTQTSNKTTVDVVGFCFVNDDAIIQDGDEYLHDSGKWWKISGYWFGSSAQKVKDCLKSNTGTTGIIRRKYSVTHDTPVPVEPKYPEFPLTDGEYVLAKRGKIYLVVDETAQVRKYKLLANGKRDEVMIDRTPAFVMSIVKNEAGEGKLARLRKKYSNKRLVKMNRGDRTDTGSGSHTKPKDTIYFDIYKRDKR